MTITLVSRTVTGRDSDGNDQYGTTETAIPGAYVYPRASVETVQGRDTVMQGLTLVVPPGVTVNPTDQIKVDTTLYEVDGDENTWVSPFTGWAPGNEVALKRVTG